MSLRREESGGIRAWGRCVVIYDLCIYTPVNIFPHQGTLNKSELFVPNALIFFSNHITVWVFSLAWWAVASWTWSIVLTWPSFSLSSWLHGGFPSYHPSLCCASSGFVEGLSGRRLGEMSSCSLWSHPSLLHPNPAEIFRYREVGQIHHPGATSAFSARLWWKRTAFPSFPCPSPESLMRLIPVHSSSFPVR